MKISVLDEKTILPAFSVPSGPLFLSESLSIGASITQVSVNEVGASFEIVGGNIDDTFAITNDKIILKKKLDYETKIAYRIVVRATFSPSPLRYVENVCTFQVEDSNDNSPIFVVEDPNVALEIYVDKYSPEGSIVARVIGFYAFYFTGSVFYMFCGFICSVFYMFYVLFLHCMFLVYLANTFSLVEGYGC